MRSAKINSNYVFCHLKTFLQVEDESRWIRWKSIEKKKKKSIYCREYKIYCNKKNIKKFEWNNVKLKVWSVCFFSKTKNKWYRGGKRRRDKKPKFLIKRKIFSMYRSLTFLTELLPFFPYLCDRYRQTARYWFPQWTR